MVNVSGTTNPKEECFSWRLREELAWTTYHHPGAGGQCSPRPIYSDSRIRTSRLRKNAEGRWHRVKPRPQRCLAPNLFALQPISFTLIPGTWQYFWPDPYQFSYAQRSHSETAPKHHSWSEHQPYISTQSGVQINICHLLNPSCPLNARHLLPVLWRF